MRSLILFAFLALLIPFTLSAQKYEIGVQGGYDRSASVVTQNQLGGLSCQVRFGYHPLKHASLTIFYQLDVLKHEEIEDGGGTTRAHSIGLSLDFVSRYFYVGVDGKVAILKATYESSSYPDVSYNISPGYGIHVGARQKLSKRIFLTEQLGYEHIYANGSISYPANELPLALTGIGFNRNNPTDANPFSGVYA